jgi:hypothetical protein
MVRVRDQVAIHRRRFPTFNGGDTVQNTTIGYGEVQEICFTTRRLTVKVIGAQGFSDSGGRRYDVGDSLSDNVDMFQPRGRFECNYDCGFSSDDRNAVGAHEQVSSPCLHCGLFVV